MNIDKYKYPMDELPIVIQESLRDEICNLEFSGFKDVYKSNKESSFATRIYRNEDGEFLVTCITDMPEVTPKMIDWWFGWHLPRTERYKLWHPLAHVSSILKEDNSIYPTDKEKYINKDSYVKEYIGKDLNHLCISFVDPQEFGFPILNSEEETAICAHVQDLKKRLSIASLTHLVAKYTDGSRMQRSFWLGANLKHSNSFLNFLFNRLLNNKKIKSILLKEVITKNLLSHCAEEMNHLSKFLPSLYRDLHKS
ncbi:MAG: hypothetical protein P8J93_08225 [SAR86 cluster bacterium]|jgi:hypothetical protein|nr:hypothetical protein [SAR86 cluster bacterium]